MKVSLPASKSVDINETNFPEGTFFIFESVLHLISHWDKNKFYCIIFYDDNQPVTTYFCDTELDSSKITIVPHTKISITVKK